MLIELFSLGVTAEALRANIGSKSATSIQRRPVDPKFQVEGVVLDQRFFFSENWAKWSLVWYKNVERSFFRSITMHTSDRQTNRQTEFSSLDRVCIPCSAVKCEEIAWILLACTTAKRNTAWAETPVRRSRWELMK